MGINLRSLSPLLTSAVLVWALLQPLHAERVPAPPLVLVSCDAQMTAEADRWSGADPAPQISNFSLRPAVILD